MKAICRSALLVRWNRAVGLMLSATLFANLCSPQAAAQGQVLTVVTSGLVVGQVLKELESKAYNIIGRAAEAGNLAADAAARNALLAVDSEREALNRDLTTQWDNLDKTKQGIVKELDSYISNIEMSFGRVERLEELSTLDVDGLLKAIPGMPKTYAIKSVTGSLFYRENGEYRLIVRSNAFDFSDHRYNFQIDGHAVDAKWIQQSRQYEIGITVPAAYFSNKFDERRPTLIALGISAEVADRQPWEMWRQKTRWAYFKAMIRLYPKFPVEYRLEEHRSTYAPDRSREEWWSSQVVTVGGCGDSGCDAYYNVYAYLPSGTEATGRVTECSDSYSTHGNFVQQTGTLKLLGGNFPIYQSICTHLNDVVNATEVSGTTVRMYYQQHSHDKTRNISFKAGYHPVSAQSSIKQVELVPINIKQDGKAGQKELSAYAVLKAVPAGIPVSLLGGFISHSEATENSRATDTNLPTIRLGFLQYGQSYEGTLSKEEDGYTLTAKDFAGNLIVVTESKRDPQIEVKETNLSTFKRIIVTLKLPW